MSGVTGTISQKGVTGSMSQKGVTGSMSQKGITGSISESGYVVPIVPEWTPDTPLGGETPDLWLTSRSGYNMVDSLGGAPHPLMPAVFSKYYTNDVASIYDNGALDIGNTYDFTLYAVIRNENASAASAYCVGKGVAGSLDGKYMIASNTSTGYWSAQLQTSGGSKTVNSTIDSRSSGFTHLMIEISQATKKFRFYIYTGGAWTLQGTEQTWTGTIGSPGNEIGFHIGAGQGASDPWALYAISRTSHGNTMLMRRLLTAQEKTNLILGIIPSDVGTNNGAYWPCNTFLPYDVSGNGFHLIKDVKTPAQGLLDGANILWGDKGSIHPLEYGYSLYKHPYGADLQVPYLMAGTPIVTPTVPDGYYFVKNVAGDTDGHNKANSMIAFTGANWDRSNATIYSANARTAYAPVQTYTSFESGDGIIKDCYLAATPKAWHISELLDLRQKYYLNSDYQQLASVKFSDDSLDEVIAYATVKTGANLKLLLDYTLNYDSYHDISYEFQAVHWCATRGSKVLAFNSTTKVLSLSLDGGSSFPITKDLTGVVTYITRAHFYSNGNIGFAGHDKIFYSNNNLSTYQEATTLNPDGSPFVPNDYNNFRPWQENDYINIGGYEVDTWATYSVVEDTEYNNINVWCSLDGSTVRSLYRADVTLVGGLTYPARHLHNATIVDGKILMTSGDGTDECFVFQGTLTLPAMTCVWTLVAGDNDGGSDANDNNNSPYKISGVYKYGDYLFWQNDAQTMTIHRHGLWRVLYSEYPDLSTAERIIRKGSTIVGEGSGFFADSDGIIINAGNGSYDVYISTDSGQTFFKHILTGGPALPANWGGIYTICPKNTAGEYRGEIIEDAEVIATNFQNYTDGIILLLKIVKPE